MVYNADLRDIHKNRKEEPEEYKAWQEAIATQTGVTFQTLMNNAPLLIPEDEFEAYAQQYAEDVGLIQDINQWPATCIDWKKAAEQLRMDYTPVEVDGVTYLFRY